MYHNTILLTCFARLGLLILNKIKWHANASKKLSNKVRKQCKNLR